MISEPHDCVPTSIIDDMDNELFLLLKFVWVLPWFGISDFVLTHESYAIQTEASVILLCIIGSLHCSLCFLRLELLLCKF